MVLTTLLTLALSRSSGMLAILVVCSWAIVQLGNLGQGVVDHADYRLQSALGLRRAFSLVSLLSVPKNHAEAGTRYQGSRPKESVQYDCFPGCGMMLYV